jgi:hypothetical protein
LKVLAFLVVAVAMAAEAQEIVALQTRPGVTQSFFIAGMGERKAEAAAMLLRAISCLARGASSSATASCP